MSEQRTTEPGVDERNADERAIDEIMGPKLNKLADTAKPLRTAETQCVCRPEDWVGDPQPVCSHFDDDDQGFCLGCNHPEECHRAIK